MEDGREALLNVAREARVLLERERRRGRKRFALGVSNTSTSPDPEEPTSGRCSWSRAGRVDRREPPQPAPADCDEVMSDQRGRGPVSRRSDPAHPLPAKAPSGCSSGSGGVEVLALPGFETAPASASAPRLGRTATPLAPHADLPQDLPALERLVSTCRECKLCETRTQTVFADGSAAARLMFIGEAPGRDEDAQGLPFVGRAGQLLNRMIAAIELKREDVYIGNVLKCRPPENRTPEPEEVERCLPYLEQQIALLKPALICALGLSAAQALLQTKASMASLRGRTFEYRGIPLVPTYHPAALLRNPSLKREAWVDLQRVRDLMRAEGPR